MVLLALGAVDRELAGGGPWLYCAASTVERERQKMRENIFAAINRGDQRLL